MTLSGSENRDSSDDRTRHVAPWRVHFRLGTEFLANPPSNTTILGTISGKSCWTSASVALAVGIVFFFLNRWYRTMVICITSSTSLSSLSNGFPRIKKEFSKRRHILSNIDRNAKTSFPSLNPLARSSNYDERTGVNQREGNANDGLFQRVF